MGEMEAKKEESQSMHSEEQIIPKPKRQKLRPQSANFISQRNSKIAILTHLEGTPPPILPSSVRVHTKTKNVTFSKSVATNNNQPIHKKTTKYFFSPNAAQPNNVSFHFQPYTKIKGKKRHRSTSANSLELPPINNTLNDMINLESPRSILRLGSHAKSAMSPSREAISTKSNHSKTAKAFSNKKKSKSIEIFKSLTPKYSKQSGSTMITSITPIQQKQIKAIGRTKSNDDQPRNEDNNLLISPAVKLISSPYSTSTDKLIKDHHHQTITIHEEKTIEQQQNDANTPHHKVFQFETVIQENK